MIPKAAQPYPNHLKTTQASRSRAFTSAADLINNWEIFTEAGGSEIEIQT